MEGQRGPKRGFPTLRCDAPGAVDAAATLPRAAERRRDAVDAATLRCWSGAAMLLALRRCDAGATLRRCCMALRRCDPGRCDAVGAAALRRGTLRRCWRCDASFCKSAHGMASRLDTLYST